jgi:hypothetical protein
MKLIALLVALCGVSTGHDNDRPTRVAPDGAFDAVSPGMKILRNEVLRIDGGPFAAQLCSRVQVKDGDTLSALAKQHLGDADRTAEILAVNVGLQADKLQAGQWLWLPPKGPLAKGEEPLFLFAGNPFSGVPEHTFVPLDTQQRVGPIQRGLLITLVPASQLVAFTDLIAKAKRNEEVDKQIEARKIPQAFAIAHRDIRAESKAEKVVLTVELTREGKEGKLGTKVIHKYYDKAGKEVDPNEVDPEAKKQRDKLFFLLLAVAASGGVLLLVRRRQQIPALKVA